MYVWQVTFYELGKTISMSRTELYSTKSVAEEAMDDYFLKTGQRSTLIKREVHEYCKIKETI